MAEQQSLADIPAGPATPATPPLGVVAERVPVLRRLRAVRLAVLIILFATRSDLWVGSSARQVTDDAYIRGDITPLSAKVEGYVRQVPVADFQIVKKGDLLV
jgi:membrane fusion protein (multidrug efflux system)